MYSKSMKLNCDKCLIYKKYPSSVFDTYATNIALFKFNIQQSKCQNLKENDCALGRDGLNLTKQS